MIEFKKILMPVDLSEVSPKLVDYARAMGEKFSAEIHVIYVVRDFIAHSSALAAAAADVQDLRNQVLENAAETLQAFVQGHLGDYPQVKMKVISGDPSDSILEYIEKKGISLVVMGTHGRKGLDKVIFGSVAQRIVQMSTAPVMTVNPYRGQAAE